MANHLPEAPFLIPSFGAVDFSTWTTGIPQISSLWHSLSDLSQFLGALLFWSVGHQAEALVPLSLLLLLWLYLISRASSRGWREKKAVGFVPPSWGHSSTTQRKVSLPYSADFFSCHWPPHHHHGDCLISGVQETREKRTPQGVSTLFLSVGVAFHLHEKD